MSGKIIRIVYNNSCLNCDALNKEMVRVGSMDFCTKCCQKIFHTVLGPPNFLYEAVIDSNNPNCKKWMKVHIKRRNDFMEALSKETEDKKTIWECLQCGETEEWIDEDRAGDDDPICPYCHKEMWKEDTIPVK